MVAGMETTIRAAIAAALQELGVAEANFVVEHPAELSHGDYATNVALSAAKTLGKKPRELAEELVLLTVLKNIPGVAGLSVAGPGFINFHLTREFFTEQLTSVSTAGEQWGRNDSWSGKKVVVEYTSPNLFKPLHIGNLVGNIIGEATTRLFEMNGADVKRFNYPSDIGLTVAKGVWGLQKTGGDPNDITALGEAYRTGNTAYEAGGAEAEEIKMINKALYENTDPELSALREQGIATSKARLNELLLRLGTKFDHEITESMASAPGAEKVRANIGSIFVESDGAVVYEGEKVGLHTRVFLNSKGLPTYEAKDVGHFTLKDAAESDWEHSIIVTGNEQAEYFKVVFAALKELFPQIGDRTLEHIPTGFLTLTTGKMSSRQGNVLTGESLLEEMEAAAQARAEESRNTNVGALVEEVAVAALKYEILRHGVGSNIIFDKERALSFEGDSGPYLQYTHARICSVLEKAAAAGVVMSTASAPTEPYVIEKLIYQFPEVIAEALAERGPQKVVGYLTELASAFNAFYAHEKIADPSDEFAPYKAAVADSVRQTLKNGLWVLGMKSPESM